MRDSRTLAKRRRRQRRAMLVLMLLAGTPALADQPQNLKLRLLPPLPLKTIAHTNPVQGNPFCVAPQQPGGVQLASGTDSGAVRLKPIDASLRLQEIPPSQTTAHDESSGQSVSLNGGTPQGIRTNPMGLPQRQQNEAFNNAPPTAKRTAASIPSTTAPRSSIRLLTPATAQPPNVQRGTHLAPAAHDAGTPFPTASASPAIPTTQNAQTAQELSARNQTPVDATFKASPNPVLIAMEPEETRSVETLKDSEPILFSFSDDGAPVTPAEQVQQDPIHAVPQVGKSEADPKVEADAPAEVNATEETVAVVLAEPITMFPTSAPKSILTNPKSTADETNGFADVKIAHPNVTVDTNPYAEDDGVFPESPVRHLLSDEIEATDQETRTLAFAPSVIVEESDDESANESPLALGVVEPIRLDSDEVSQPRSVLDNEPRSVLESPAGSSILATSDDVTTGDVTTGDSALVPMEDAIDSNSGEPIAIYRPEPVMAKPVPSTEPDLHSTRYRPPVAVMQVPIAFERQEIETNQEFAVTSAAAPPVAEMKIDNLGVELGPEVKLTPLHMNQAQVRSLTLGGSVRRVRVGDKDICQAFASGPNQLKLIGTGKGVTRLVVWAEAKGAQQKTLMRAFEIHVGDISPKEGEPVSDTVKLLNQSIQRAFPTCQINVQLVRGELHVVGKCDNQESAKKIIRMVRKSCLIPVRDQMSVQ